MVRRSEPRPLRRGARGIDAGRSRTARAVRGTPGAPGLDRVAGEPGGAGLYSTGEHRRATRCGWAGRVGAVDALAGRALLLHAQRRAGPSSEIRDALAQAKLRAPSDGPGRGHAGARSTATLTLYEAQGRVPDGWCSRVEAEGAEGLWRKAFGELQGAKLETEGLLEPGSGSDVTAATYLPTTMGVGDLGDGSGTSATSSRCFSRRAPWAGVIVLRRTRVQGEGASSVRWPRALRTPGVRRACAR